MSAGGKRHFRAVTHYWIRPEHITFVLETLKKELM